MCHQKMMWSTTVLLTISVATLAQYESYSAKFGRLTSNTCEIVNGGIYVNGQLKRMMTSDDVAALNDYNKKVQTWKYGVRDAILAALPVHIDPGQPTGFSEWPFGSANNPFAENGDRKRRGIGSFPDAPTFCNPSD